jgi:cell division protein FtsQ
VVAILAFAAYRLSDPLVLTAASLRDFILDNRYFSVHEIQVRGGDKVSGNEIVTIAGLHQGMSIWKVDLPAIEKKVGKHPWVRRVLVRREFPHRIIIDVEERVPRAIVALRKLYYVDTDGVVFKEVDPNENVKYPLLTGLRAEEVSGSNPAMRKRIQDAIRLGDLMAQHMGWGNWDDKLERMDRLMSLWKGNEERLGSLDMSFRDQIVARLRRVQR